MDTLPLLGIAERVIIDTSRDAFDRVRLTLTRREVAVFRALHEYLAATGREDVTGGELTEWMKTRHAVRDVNGVRPRLTGLQQAGWIHSLHARQCRAYGTSAHPYSPVVPLSALHDLNPNDGGR
jgi:hypothetical protein